MTGVNGSSSSSNNSIFADLFTSSTMAAGSLQSQTCSLSDFICAMARSERSNNFTSASSTTEPLSLCLSNNVSSALFATQDHLQFAPPPPPQPTMSATALLQKAAQIGAATNSSLLRGLGVSVSSSSSSGTGLQELERLQWSHQIESNEPVRAVPGLGIGDGGAELTDLMMGPSSIFDPKPTTLDFLGLGMGGGGGAPKGGFSALINSFGGGNLSGKTWEGHK